MLVVDERGAKRLDGDGSHEVRSLRSASGCWRRLPVAAFEDDGVQFILHESFDVLVADRHGASGSRTSWWLTQYGSQRPSYSLAEGFLCFRLCRILPVRQIRPHTSALSALNVNLVQLLVTGAFVVALMDRWVGAVAFHADYRAPNGQIVGALGIAKDDEKEHDRAQLDVATRDLWALGVAPVGLRVVDHVAPDKDCQEEGVNVQVGSKLYLLEAALGALYLLESLRLHASDIAELYERGAELQHKHTHVAKVPMAKIVHAIGNLLLSAQLILGGLDFARLPRLQWWLFLLGRRVLHEWVGQHDEDDEDEGEEGQAVPLVFLETCDPLVDYELTDANLGAWDGNSVTVLVVARG